MNNSWYCCRLPRHGVILPGLVVVLLCFASAAWARQTRAVWSAAGEQGHLDLFESTLSPQTWSKPECLVSNETENITPAIAEGADGTVLLAWIARDASGQALLHYLFRFAGGKKLQGVVDTGFAHNYAPSVLIDNRNTPWVAWASDDGTDEDIYASRFDGRAWSSAYRVNQDDDTPDIKPLLTLLPSGEVQVVWPGFDTTGYRPYQATWSGSGFSGERAAKEDPAQAAHNKTACSALPPLPAMAAKRLMATIFNSENKGLQSVPEWVAPCMPKPLP